MPRLRDGELCERFAEFWSRYPKREDIAFARREWQRQAAQHEGGEDGLMAEVIAALEWQVRLGSWRTGHIPKPATYLEAQAFRNEEPEQQPEYEDPVTGLKVKPETPKERAGRLAREKREREDQAARLAAERALGTREEQMERFAREYLSAPDNPWKPARELWARQIWDAVAIELERDFRAGVQTPFTRQTRWMREREEAALPAAAAPAPAMVARIPWSGSVMDPVAALGLAKSIERVDDRELAETRRAQAKVAEVAAAIAAEETWPDYKLARQVRFKGATTPEALEASRRLEAHNKALALREAARLGRRITAEWAMDIQRTETKGAENGSGEHDEAAVHEDPSGPADAGRAAVAGAGDGAAAAGHRGDDGAEARILGGLQGEARRPRRAAAGRGERGAQGQGGARGGGRGDG